MERFKMDYKFVGETELLTEEILNELYSMNITIYHNDTTAKHWIFDFAIKNVLFEGIEVFPNCENVIIFNVAKDPFSTK